MSLEPRINRLAFQGEHTKYCLMHPAQWFFADKSFERFDTQRMVDDHIRVYEDLAKGRRRATPRIVGTEARVS